jgi:hypothetical protein
MSMYIKLYQNDGILELAVAYSEHEGFDNVWREYPNVVCNAACRGK